MTARSRYRSDAEPDYGHRFHAGNVGDVWKHCVLAETLARVGATATRTAYLDSHAGAGSYALGPTGEWTEGIGRVWAAEPPAGVVARYLALCRRLGDGAAQPTRYPGSPRIARAVLGAAATLRLWERDRDTCARLTGDVSGDPRVVVTCGDGLAALPDAVVSAEAASDGVVALVDPPWTQKADWIAVPDVVADAATRGRRATIILWYPVKSLTRPNAMMLRLRATGVAATMAELVTTPLEHQRHRLNGSGVLLIRPPGGLLEAIAEATATLGRLCATRPETWSSRMVSWSGDTRSPHTTHGR